MHKHSIQNHQAVIRVYPQNTWLLFENPVGFIQSYCAAEVFDCLLEIDDLVQNKGKYAAGFLSYESSPAFDPCFKVKTGDKFPLLRFGIFDTVRALHRLVCDRQQGAFPAWRTNTDFANYQSRIQSIKNLIKAGESYQINYTLRLYARFACDPWQFFVNLALAHDPPYACYLDYPDFSVCSFSPELFFQMDKEKLISRPMKGTAPRGLVAWEDDMLARQLQRCTKNMAENVMITDMVRNDFGRIAEPGSVETSSLFGVEKYPTVWQMVSEVTCKSKANIPAVFNALFPPASITGAPKAAAMDIIARLETALRKIYTGSIGYMGPDRQCQFNVAIRTVLVDKKNNSAEYGVGGGIVWDSDAHSEWQECKIKSQALYRIRPEFNLFESILWTPQGGYHLLGAHLARLKTSAHFFKFNFDMLKVKCTLHEFVESLISACKVRLELSKSGHVIIEQKPIMGLPDVINVSLAKEAVSSSNVFLYHKTTCREAYEKAEPRKKSAHDIILWNEKGEVTETTIANLVLDFGERLYTPPVKSGLLPGTYRQFLLSSGIIQEKIISVSELQFCKRIYLVNSVRGFMKGALV